MQTGRPIRLHSHHHHAKLLALCLAGALLTACGGGADEKISALDSSNTRRASAANTSDPKVAQAEKRRTRPYSKKGVTSILMAPDGKVIGVASADGKVSLVDAQSVIETLVLSRAGAPAMAALIFADGGRYLIGVGRDSVAQVWSVDSGERL